MSGGRYTQSDSPVGSTGTLQMPMGCTRSGCTLAPPGEYDLNSPYAVAMRPYVKLFHLLALVGAEAEAVRSS